MHSRFFLAGAVVIGLASGCKNHREAYLVEVFNAQNLILEDKIYELSDRIAALESRDEPTSPRAPRLLDTRPTNDDSSAEPSDDVSPEEEIPDLSPPEVEPGTPTDPEELAPPEVDDELSSARNASHLPAPKDTNVVDMVIAPETRLRTFDQQPGTGGAWIVLEPQNEQGQSVPVAAKVSVGVRDAKTKVQLGEWHFDAAVVSRSMRVVNGRHAIVLPVKWKEAPEAAELELAAIYYKSAKQLFSKRATLVTRQQPSHVADRPSHSADRWTKRPSRPPSSRPESAATKSSLPSGEEGPGAEVYR